MVEFTIEECNKIISLSTILEMTDRDGLNSNFERKNESISYKFYNIPNTDETNWIFQRFNNYLKESDGLEVIKDIDVIHLHKYDIGNKFTKHRDIYYDNQHINVGACLNDNFDGGDFILYSPDVTINKKAGNIYSFKNTRLHEVTEITKGTRWSLIGFYFENNFKEIKKSVL